MPSAVTWVGQTDIPYSDVDDCCGTDHAVEATSAAGARLRLGEMDSHLHCSVIGTCLSTAELRKLMARFIHVEGASDLDVHHEAVRLASQNAEVSRALHKALDRRHAPVVQRFARAKDEAAVATLWDQCLKSGEVPGAYWAVLTHRRAASDLRQRVFGDVHMLSHLVGAANRADIRRLVAIEQENAEWRERAERQQDRLLELATERDSERAECQRLQARILELERAAESTGSSGDASSTAAADALSAQLAIQTQRREAAEAAVAVHVAERSRHEQQLDHLRKQMAELVQELAAAETQLRVVHAQPDAASALRETLTGRKLLYVGGRPSSNPAIRDLVLRHGGEYQRHDGGIEDRKGLLASALAWADLVTFPVDCVDHDSALALKRSCIRLSKRFVPLRSASVASFAAGITAMSPAAASAASPCDGPCLKHG